MVALDANAIVRVLIEDDVGQAQTHQAEKLFSFDRKLQTRFPFFESEPYLFGRQRLFG
ncbi:hypothetical protein DSCA_27180 [Desulfosarcina alkanivorans]|uniref:PIN domain-containing protein n=1 Tax=Desulfosarcina alkanivorans TaxID=571177 RepID=A0A5K7YIM9_9BACT|nr:hypothetical protein [Desulfosarcina alkanivorans]BBO68788.1 hypothetical protein DSCA_27180 [Desulfosarcina alkanivorans]